MGVSVGTAVAVGIAVGEFVGTLAGTSVSVEVGSGVRVGIGVGVDSPTQLSRASGMKHSKSQTTLRGTLTSANPYPSPFTLLPHPSPLATSLSNALKNWPITRCAPAWSRRWPTPAILPPTC